MSDFNLGTLVYKLIGDASALNAAISEGEKGVQDLDSVASKSTRSIGENFAKMRDFMLGPVNAAKQVIDIFQGIKQKVDELETAWANQVESEAKVNAVLKATGAESWTTKEHILELASSLQNVTTYGDETILSMQGVLLGFRNITGANFDAATKAVLDMATVMKMDLTAAAQAVGKALDNPALGLDSLSKQGFKFTEQEKEMLKVLQDTGRLAEAQDIILKELNRTFGGASEAVAKTSTGLKEQLHNAIGDVNEQIGHSISDILKPFRQAWLDMAQAVGAALKAQNDFKDSLDATKNGTATANQELEVANTKYANLSAMIVQAQENQKTYASEAGASLIQSLIAERDAQYAIIVAVTDKTAKEKQAAATQSLADKASAEAAKKKAEEVTKEANFISKRTKLESDYFDQIDKINRLQSLGMITEKQASEQKLSALDAEIKGLNDLFQTDKDNSPKTLELIQKRTNEYKNQKDAIAQTDEAVNDAISLQGHLADYSKTVVAGQVADAKQAAIDKAAEDIRYLDSAILLQDHLADYSKTQFEADVANAREANQERTDAEKKSVDEAVSLQQHLATITQQTSSQSADDTEESERRKRKAVQATANVAISAIDSAAKLMQSTNDNLLENTLDLVSKIGISSGNVIGAIVGVVAYAAKSIIDTFDAADKRRKEEEKAQQESLATFKKAQDDYKMETFNVDKEILQNKINNNKTELENTLSTLQQKHDALVAQLAADQDEEQKALQKNIENLDIKQAEELDAKGLLSLSEKQSLIEKKALLGEATQSELDQLNERQKIELKFAEEAQKLKDDQKARDDARQAEIDRSNTAIADAKAAAAKEDRRLMIEMAQLEKDMALAKAQIDKANAPVSTLHHKDVTGYTPEWTETVKTASGWKDVTHKPEPIYNEWDETITQNALYDALIASIQAIEIPALAMGGIARRPTLAKIGDNASYPELVAPLSPGFFADMADSLINSLAMRARPAGVTEASVAAATQSVSKTYGSEVHLHVGTLVADSAGLRELDRRLRPYTQREDVRVGS